MPQAIPAIIAAAQAAYAAAVSYTAQFLGATGISTLLPAGTTYAVSAGIVNTAIQAVIGIGISAITRPSIPDPEFARTNKKQAIPDRVSGYGRVRLGGAYMLYEAIDNKAYNVFAMHDGMIDGWEALYLNDEVETILGSGFVQQGSDDRYGASDLVEIDERVGLVTETHYSQVPTSIWPTTARGDNIASLMMIARSAKVENFLSDYPNGLPQPSRVGRLQLCYDARLGGRGTINSDADKLASATWQWTMNPVWQLLDYMTNPSTGMGLDYTTKFAPYIADWITAANVCDEAVALAAGGTVPRYQAAGVYLHSTPPADVIGTILETFNGWMCEINGAYTIQAGKYYAPTVTITDDHITDLSRQSFRADEEAVNELIISYTDPAFDYTEVEAEAWRDQNDIDKRNGSVRSQRLSLPWVPNKSQARRLAKIAMARAVAPLRGTMVTTLDGLRAMGERRIRIQAPSDGAILANIVVDVLAINLDPNGHRVTISFQSCDPNAYDWDAATEEGDGPGSDDRPALLPLDAPVILDVDPFEASVGGATGIRLRVSLDTPAFDDLTYMVRWRESGETVWNEEAARAAVLLSGVLTVDTGFVPAVASLDVQVRAVSGGGRISPWTATFNTDTGYSDPVDEALDAYLAARAVQPNATRKARYRAFIKSLMDDGVWAKLFVLHIPGTDDVSGAPINWISPGSHNLVPHGSLVFTQYTGWAGDAVSAYLGLGVGVDTLAGYSLNSQHVGIWINGDAATTNPVVGQISGSARTYINPETSGGQFQGRLGTSTAVNFGASTNRAGHFVVARASSSAVRGYRNGVLVSSQASTSVAPTGDTELTIFRSASAYTNDRASAVHFGLNITDTETAALYDALAALLA